MFAKEAADHLGISQRVLRHYEKMGLLTPARAMNDYRVYGPADLRRAARIRDLIATGFSTREIRDMRACLSDEADGPCPDGIDRMTAKLAHIERLQRDLDARRAAVLARIAKLRAAEARDTAPKVPEPA